VFYAANLTNTAKFNVLSMGVSFGMYVDAMKSGEIPPVFSLADPFLCWYLRLEEVSGNWKLVISDNEVSGSGHGGKHWASSTTIATATQYFVEIATYNASLSGSSFTYPCRVKLFNSSGSLLDDSGWQVAKNRDAAWLPLIENPIIGPGILAGSITVADNKITYDDLLLTQSAPPPERAKVLPVVSTGNDATDNAWTSGTAGNKWDDVDEAGPDDDTTYITSGAASGSNQAFTHAATGLGSSDNILGVGVVARAKAEAAGNTRIVTVRVRTSSGASTAYASQSSSAAYTYLWGQRVTSVAGNGWTATGGAETDVDNCSFGLSTSVGSGNARVTQTRMQVAYGANYRDDFLPRVGWLSFQNAIGGTVSVASTTTLTDSLQSWPLDVLSGATIKIDSGTGSGQSRHITTNTATTVTISAAWTTNPDSTSKYSIHMTGTATAGAGTTLTNTNKAWRVGQLKDMVIRITGGTGATETVARPEGSVSGPQERIISTNTATVVTVSRAWGTNPDNTSTYEIFATERNAA
jgi:hypothetical protein